MGWAPVQNSKKESNPWELKPRALDPFAAFLSYLVPGMGQMFQGRVGKGLLFLACIYTLFFWGMAIGQWKNVYLPRADDANRFRKPELALGPWSVPFFRPLSYRIQFMGQFWVGVAAWPAIIQYLNYDDETSKNYNPQNPPPPHPLLGTYMRTPTEAELNQLQTEGDKIWELGWVYTLIAGILNLLVIYDAFAGPAFPTPTRKANPKSDEAASPNAA